MASRRLVSASVRDNLLGIASDIGSLERNYVLPDEDLALTATRRRPYNRLGLAIHIALLRHPGQGWLDGIEPPAPFVAWLGEQVDVSSAALIRYATRGPTRSEHRRLAIEHLGLHVFVPAEHMRAAIRLATRAAFDTDDGIAILQRLTSDMRTQRLVLPSADTLERIGLAGRARARRLSAQALNDALDTPRKHALMDLLKHDSAIGRSRLTWLRALPHSTSAASMQGLLERLRHVRMIDVPRDLGTTIHPARLAKFAREGAVAPLSLLNDFGERRRIATLAAQLSELDTTLTDAAIALFERLTAQLFTRSSRTRDQSWSASKTQVGRLIRLFGGAIDAMVRAREQDRDPFDVIDEAIGWDRMLASRDEIATLGDLATEDPLSLAAGRYTQLRRFAPAFLEIFEFDAPTAGQSLQAAVQLLRELNRSGRRKLPDIVPMPFTNRQWSAVVLKDGKPDRRAYETAVVATLRDRLRAGDVWVEGSRDYRRFDAYLPPANEAEPVLAESGLQTDGGAWLADRRNSLNRRLAEVGAKLARGRLEGVRLENGRLRITPHDAVTPPAGERLDRAIDVLMPRIRITDLLWEVNVRTGFLDAFTDLRSGRVHSNPAAVLAGVLAGATNLGLERMARASSGVSHAQLSWAHAWYLRPETYADALARIIDAHHALSFARVWGSADRTSSDGQFFSSARNAGEINAKYGPDPGLKIYSFLSGRYGSFHSNVIGATAGEAPFVLDGLVGNAAEFDPLVHHVDTGGVSDHVFALFHLLGLSFAPRLRDFPDRRLACFGSPRRWRALSPIMGRPINEDLMLEHWSDVLRLAAGIKTLSVKPSSMLRKLGAYRQQNRLHLALGEVGRIERSLFMLDWIESPQLRMECQAGLNKGEARHALARAVFAHSQGRIRDRSHDAQQKRVMALNLVIAAIVYWNTSYMDKASEHLRRQGRLPDPNLLRHVSPLGWDHIVLTGDYDWNSGAEQRSNVRPLNLYPAKIRA